MNNDLSNSSSIRDKLDKKIAEHMTRPTLVDKVKSAQKHKLIPAGWSKDLHDHWYIYVMLGVSALFTITLGIYMGLSPTLVTAPDGSVSIVFNTDVGHILLAIVYSIAFFSVTEVAFLIFKWRYFTREEGNQAQEMTMLAGMIISGISILLTGWAGGTVVAHNIAFLSEFQEIPPVAQKWVVVAIPLLLTLYAFLFSAYALSSEAAQAERITTESTRRMTLDHQTRMRGIEAVAEEELQLAEIDRFLQLVQIGKISAADARAAIRAGRTLGQEEARQSRDIDGDGMVGLRTPVVHPIPEPMQPGRNGKENF